MATKTKEYSKGTEWTIMIYSAGDNALAPLIVSQLKALKDAGRHPDVNVVGYVDPSVKGVPTRVYCLNQAERFAKRSATDSWVRNLDPDDVELSRIRTDSARDLCKALNTGDSLEAKPALQKFLNFCKENYPARHYILLLVGHGMIVGNDAFLPDEAPISSITLKDLGTLLKGFGGKLELLALHSCSMSAIEVAYELRGKANYMIASEGLSFIQGWPYRNLLMRIFSLLDEARNDGASASRRYSTFDVKRLVEKLYFLTYYNGRDFMRAGYSQDLALINLKADFSDLTKAVKALVRELKKGLRSNNEQAKRLIQLAHLESQSYFDESYTDLYDFCHCLAESVTGGSLRPLREACEQVMAALEPNNSPERKERFEKIVVHSKIFGYQYQYSHGLSVYFPWSKPVGDAENDVLKKYEGYKFSTELGEDSWLRFLNAYLERTKRKPRLELESDPRMSAMVAATVGSLHKPVGAGGVDVDHKPTGGGGAGCNCPSIKNFPTEELPIKGKTKRIKKPVVSKRNRYEKL